MEYLFGSLIIRVVNAALWVWLGARILSDDVPINRLARRMVVTVLIFGMSMLAIGGFAPFGLPQEAVRWLYTIFSAYSAIVALALLTTE